MESVIELTQRCVDIASYVDARHREDKLGAFLRGWMKRFLPDYRVREIETAPGRVNFFCVPRHQPLEVLFTAHQDTVLPFGTFAPATLNQHVLRGTGSVDMKGALAAMLMALKNAGREGRAGLLLYVDEEYDFAGMKTMLDQIKSLSKPALIVTGEATDRKISNGCRGFGVVQMEIRGRTAHSARPAKGKSVAEAISIVEQTLKALADRARHPVLGSTLVNLYHAEWGFAQHGEKTDQIVASDNRLPDLARLAVSWRLADPRTRLSAWKAPLNAALRKQGYHLTRFEIIHEWRPMFTPPETIKVLETLVRRLGQSSPYNDLGSAGYYDIQMLSEIWKVPAVSIGAGPKRSAHSPDEHVRCSDLVWLEKLYTEIALTGKRLLG